MSDVWAEATFAGAAVARARRHAQLTPEQRLEWLEAALREADRAGVMTQVRRRQQREALAAWESSDPR